QREKLESLLTDCVHQIERYEQATHRERDAQIRQAISWGWGVQGFIVLVCMGIVLLLTRTITAPLAQVSTRMESLSGICLNNLSHAISALTRGDMTAPVQTETEPIEVRGNDEFGRLGATFNAM